MNRGSILALALLLALPAAAKESPNLGRVSPRGGQRGTLDSTLVMVTSEFGRTPKINKDNGRDHWPKVFSVVLAGGGIKRGLIYGASDPTGAEPERDPVSIEDLATTVYDRLGINADKELMAPGARPIEIVDGGKVIKEICA